MSSISPRAAPQDCGEPDLDLEASARVRLGGDGGLVGDRDCLDDREAEPEPVGAVCAFAVESLEGLEEPVDLIGRDREAGVLDPE